MEVILLERVPKLGALGERLKVKPGYARNYLIPQGKGLPATEANIKRFEARRAELEKSAQEKLDQAESRKASLEGSKIVLAMQAGEEGRLFGSVTSHDIVRALKDAGHKVAKGEVWLPQPIRQVGEYEVELYLHGNEIVAKINLSVVSEA